MSVFSRAPRAMLTLGAAVAVLAAAGTLLAHDFWIIPNAFAIAAGGQLEVQGQTSSRFPTSESAVVPERVVDARVIGAKAEERITDLSVGGKSLVIRHRPAGDGPRIVAIALAARSSRTTPARLKNYIALEGNTELAERYEREGAYPRSDSLTQLSAKFAKTFVQVGRGGDAVHHKAVGHPLEIVPLNDPLALRAGDTIAVRLLYRGQPVQGAHLHAGVAPNATTATGSAPAAAEPKDLTAITDANGVARVPVADSGLWNVRTLHAAPVPGRTGEWEALFVTIVFPVAAGAHRHHEAYGAIARPTAHDSGDVANVVAR